MTIEVIADIVRAYARNRKTRLLAETMNFLLVLRDGRAVAVLSCSEVQPLLRAADTAAAGYGAEAIALVVESVFPRVELNPMTGRAWERGEAETLRIDANGIEEGWLSEMQIIALALRSGESEEEGWPFTMLGGSVAWSDVPLKISRTGLASALGSRLAGPVIDPATVPDPGASFVGDRVAGPFYDPDYGRVALDIGCTRILSNRLMGDGEACLIVNSVERAEFHVEEGLSRWMVEVCTTEAQDG